MFHISLSSYYLVYRSSMCQNPMKSWDIFLIISRCQETGCIKVTLIYDDQKVIKDRFINSLKEFVKLFLTEKKT